MPNTFRGALFASIVVTLLGCDTGPASDGDGDAPIDGGSEAAIACIAPLHGEMVRDAAMRRVRFVAAIRGLAAGASVSIGGVDVDVDAFGLVTRSVDVRFGINTVEVVAGEHSQLCTFLVAPEFAAPDDDSLEASATLRLTSSGIDDGDGADTLGSLDDVLTRATA